MQSQIRGVDRGRAWSPDERRRKDGASLPPAPPQRRGSASSERRLGASAGEPVVSIVHFIGGRTLYLESGIIFLVLHPRSARAFAGERVRAIG